MELLGKFLLNGLNVGGKNDGCGIIRCMNPEKPIENEIESAPELTGDSDIHEESLDVSDRHISRRKFLKAAGLGLVGAAVGASFPSIYEGAWNTLGKEGLDKSIKELETELSNKYGIRIAVWEADPNDRPTGTIRESLKERSLYRAYKSLLTLRDVLECYPPKLIKEHINGIEIVHSVQSGYEGVIAKGATPEAMTSFGGNITIRAGYQSSVSYKAMFGEALDANVLHHEISHTLTRGIPGEEWKKLHPDVQYVDNEWTKLRRNKPKGFALAYSAKSVQEDIATTAELLFANPREVEALVEHDEILHAKVEYLKKWYEMKSGGVMNSDYWEKQTH